MTDLEAAAPQPRLARVTYLPGVVPPPESAPGAPAERVAPVERETPAERDAPAEREAPAGSPALDAPTLERLRSMIAPIESASAPEPSPETEGERSARAHNVSMHALARRGVSSAEMVDLLRSRDLDEADVQFEVERLEQVGLLDDTELASTLVRSLRERKGLGRSAISAELRRRKLDQAAIDAALDEVVDDELERALVVAMKRAPQLRSLDQETARRRLGAFLMRKGYSGGVVSAAVTSALAGTSSGSGRGPRFE